MELSHVLDRDDVGYHTDCDAYGERIEREVAAAWHCAGPGRWRLPFGSSPVSPGPIPTRRGPRRGNLSPLRAEVERWPGLVHLVGLFSSAVRRDGDLSLVEQTTVGYLDNHLDPDAKVGEAINLISGLVSLGGRMLLQLAQSLGRSEDELLRIMGERIAYRS